MINLQGQEGEISMTIQIKRAETGQVEEYQLTGKITNDEFEQLTKGSDNGSNTLNSGS